MATFSIGFTVLLFISLALLFMLPPCDSQSDEQEKSSTKISTPDAARPRVWLTPASLTNFPLEITLTQLKAMLARENAYFRWDERTVTIELTRSPVRSVTFEWNACCPGHVAKVTLGYPPNNALRCREKDSRTQNDDLDDPRSLYMRFWPAEGGMVRNYAHMIMVTIFDEPFGTTPMSQATWEKLMNALDACGRK